MIAREVGYQLTSSSLPLVMLVHLVDRNDNAPTIRKVPSLKIPGGDGKREVYKVYKVSHFIHFILCELVCYAS